jgi:putative hemolysin
LSLATYLLVLLVCLVLSAIFSGSETALLRLRTEEVEEEVEESRKPSAVAVRELVSSTSHLLVTILLGNNVVNILGASVASALAVYYLGPRLGIPVATVIMTALVLVLCEVLPKAVAAAHPRGVARAVGLPLYVLHQILRPVHAVFDRVIEPAVRRVAGSGEGGLPRTSEEVLRLARKVADGTRDEGTPLAIIGATSKAAEMTVEEIMVPRTEIVAFPVEHEPGELLEEIMEDRYTRVPIYSESIDNVLGIVHLKDLIMLVRSRNGNGQDVSSILKPVIRVPERKAILPLLTDMQRGFCHVAIVKDEFGVTLGMVTQEDILEEIVGEIRDEFDRDELLTIRRIGHDSFEALGRISVLDFNRETGWSVPFEKGDTLGGLVFNTLGRAAQKGEKLEVPGYRVTAVDVSGSRITRVRIEQQPEQSTSASEAAAS